MLDHTTAKGRVLLGVDAEGKQTNPRIGPLTSDLIEYLREAYTPTPVPTCGYRINSGIKDGNGYPIFGDPCGGELTPQHVGGGQATVYGHSKPEGVSFVEWRHHYNGSRWTQYQPGDPLVLLLIERYERLVGAFAGWGHRDHSTGYETGSAK